VLTEDVGLRKIREALVKPFTTLKVAEYVDCHLFRQKEYIGFDDPKDPQPLKKLVEATGVTYIDYTNESECCAAPSVGVSDKVELQLDRDRLNHVILAEAQALITICPFCHIMSDTNEVRIKRMFGETYGIVVLRYPKMLGLALGLAPGEHAFNELRFDTSVPQQVIGVN
jgi:heterodisulfide reductase subunit B